MLKELKEVSKLRLKETDNKILTARFSGLSLNQLDRTGLKLDIDLLIFKVCAISGADLPPTDFFADILSTEISIYLKDYGFFDLTVEEVLTAFRFNAFGVSYPSGESIEKVYFRGVLNINLLGTVLNNYKYLRDCLDRKFKNEIEGY